MNRALSNGGVDTSKESQADPIYQSFLGDKMSVGLSINDRDDSSSQQAQPMSLWYRTKLGYQNFKEYMQGKRIQRGSRSVFFNGSCVPSNSQKNFIKNSKYNVFSFLPLVLYEQFHQFINIFYLGLTVTQFIPLLQVGFLIGYLGPLALVVTLSLLKELYDDILRHQRDRAINNYTYKVYSDHTRDVKAGELVVGMIVEVRCNERIPADLIVLSTKDPIGNVFIRTDQLDGETDWKLRKSVKFIQNLMNADELNSTKLTQLDAFALCGEPIDNIYAFNGVFVRDGTQKEALSLENVMWANTVLANDCILGLVIHVGYETRMAMNTKQPKTKFGLLDHEINQMSWYLFLMMAALSALVTVFSQIPFSFQAYSAAYIRYLILLSNIIPISMRVNMEFAKLIYSYNINKDVELGGTIARNSNIPESLGRIGYLLCDKTGTLTQNDMIFKKLALEEATFTQDDQQRMQDILLEQCRLQAYPAEDLHQQAIQERKTKRIKREEEAILRDLVTALALCHNVTPSNKYQFDAQLAPSDDGSRTYQASSPDEIALVKIADLLGFRILQRDSNRIEIGDPNGLKQTYHILNNFPFSSENKRMGIILYNEQADRYLFYLKGADQVMKKFVHETQRGFIDEECENLARAGLRTLVITQKVLTRAQYEKWVKSFDRASQRIEGREREITKVVALLERDMEFLGITGVEDKLQEDVCQTLESILNAGVYVWMLTGDKIETAICIAISSGIKSATQSVFLIKECVDEVKLQMLLTQYETQSDQWLMVIDGVSLSTALAHKEELFFSITSKAKSVVCCRCSPNQKAQVTECIKKYSRKVIACVGDGGNDVGMIQCADVGIGIEGKEGKQAALASDFSIQKFKYLSRLLLWHGRLSYKRSALLSQFVIHRGLIISIIQACFMFTFYFLPISIFSGVLVLGYATIFTYVIMFPVFSIILDEDVEVKIALQYPQLYQSLQKGRNLNAKTFLTWVWKATFQGSVIIVLSLVFFQSIFLSMETVAFTTLIFTEYAMIFGELHNYSKTMLVSTFGSAILYIGVIFFFPQQLLVSEMNLKFFACVLLITMLNWGPLWLLKYLMRQLNPSDYEKLMTTIAKKRLVARLFR